MDTVNYLQLPEFQDLLNYVLIEYLDITTTVRAKEVFGMIFVERIIINRIERRLRLILGKEYSNFIHIMNTCNQAISGSFITQVILDVWNWKSDIDIFCDYVEDTLLAKNYSWMVEPPNAVTEAFLRLNNITRAPRRSVAHIKEYFAYHNSFKVTDIIDYRYNKHTFQLVGINPVNLYHPDSTRSKGEFIQEINRYIKNEFDFDICTNVYYVQNNKSHIIINNLDGIVNKEIKLLRNINIFTISDRIKKYGSRGFKFDINLDKNEQLQYYLICNKTIEYSNVKVRPGIYLAESNPNDLDSEEQCMNYIEVPSHECPWGSYNYLLEYGDLPK